MEGCGVGAASECAVGRYVLWADSTSNLQGYVQRNTNNDSRLTFAVVVAGGEQHSPGNCLADSAGPIAYTNAQREVI